MQMSVRHAETAADRDAIYRLRGAIYNEELRRGHVADDEGRVTDALDANAVLLLAEHEGEAVGTMRLNFGEDRASGGGEWDIYRLDALEAVLPDRQMLVFSRFATRKAYRGGDLPGQLIDAMVRFAIARSVHAILCDCRPELINLYLQLGMRALGPLRATPVGILAPMIMILDDPAHIRETGSRVAPLLDGLTPDAGRRDALLALLPANPPVEMLDRPEAAPAWSRIIETLRQHSPERFPIMQGLSTVQIARLTAKANLIRYGGGDVVLRQGAQEHMVFVVLEGALDVVRAGRVLARLEPGSVFGEIAFLAKVPRTASVVAAGESRLICLRQSTLATLIAEEPGIAAPFLLNLSRILATRLASLDLAPSRPEPVV